MRSGLILFFIILVGVFLRIYRITPPTAVFDVFVLIGILGGLAGIAAVFLFSREMFNREIGLLSAFLTSVSSWHIAVSRESVWPNWFLFFFTLFLYFLWKGLRGSHKCNFIFSGIFLGLVLYLSFPFFIPLTIIGLGYLSYWHLLKKDLNYTEYNHGKFFILRGLALSAILAVLSFFLLYLLKNFGWSFGQEEETVSPYALSMPIIVLLSAGLFRSFFKLFRALRRHGHFSPAQTIILSWFFLGLASQEAILALPVILILAAEGCWWFFNWLKSWYAIYDKHLHEASLVSSLALILFLTGMALLEFRNYFGF